MRSLSLDSSQSRQLPYVLTTIILLYLASRRPTRNGHYLPCLMLHCHHGTFFAMRNAIVSSALEPSWYSVLYGISFRCHLSTFSTTYFAAKTPLEDITSALRSLIRTVSLNTEFQQERESREWVKAWPQLAGHDRPLLNEHVLPN